MTPDRHLEIAIARAWPVVAALVARLAAMAGLEGDTAPERLSRSVHIAVLRLLRPAEAIVRRLIVLMAREITVPDTSAPAALSPIHRGAKRRGDQTNTSRFQLFETLPTLASTWRERREKPAGPGPRILSLDAPFPAPKPAEPGLPAAPVIARIRGLERVLKDPASRARRHANFLRRIARANAPPGRINPVRPGFAPGARSRYTPPDLRELLAYLTVETRAGPHPLASPMPAPFPSPTN